MKRKPFDWKYLDHLAVLHNTKNISREGEGNFQMMLKETEKEDEHPEWYNNPCFCRECMSYADGE